MHRKRINNKDKNIYLLVGLIITSSFFHILSLNFSTFEDNLKLDDNEVLGKDYHYQNQKPSLIVSNASFSDDGLPQNIHQ